MELMFASHPEILLRLPTDRQYMFCNAPLLLVREVMVVVAAIHIRIRSALYPRDDF
jgi:hypothetical protein